MKKIIINFISILSFALLALSTFGQSVTITPTNPGLLRIGSSKTWSGPADNKNIYFGDGPYVSIGEEDADDKMVLNANLYYFKFGNVGIGNAYPSSRLQIGPDTSPAFAAYDIAIGNSAGGGMSLFQSGAATTGTSIWYSNSNFALMPAFGGTGCLGINFTNPNARLDIYQTGKVQSGFGALISPMRVGLGVTGSHATVGDNYHAVGIGAFGANASSTKDNIGLLATTGTSGNRNIGVMAYQNGNFAGTVYGNYNNLTQTGTGEAVSNYNRVLNSSNSTSTGVYSEVANTSTSGALSNFGVTATVSSNNANASAANYGFYANATGSGNNYGLFTSASGSLNSYAVAAYGKSFFDSFVAIGSTSIPAIPLAKLVVTGFQGTTTGTSSYLNPNSSFNSGPTSSANNSIYATHGIVSGLYVGSALLVVSSDNRIKNIKGISNSAQDLERLRKIEITDYTMKDAVTWGNKTFKKVIAQQVEQVYPEVIKLQTSVIPDIYALTENVKYDAAKKELKCVLAKEYNIKVGEKIEIVHGEKGKIIAEVIEVSGMSFTVKDWEYAADKVFVFGRQVNDFRSVDYEAISMLGISAIQQLAKENEELRAKSDRSEASILDLRTKFEKLESLLLNSSAMNPETKTVNK